MVSIIETILSTSHIHIKKKKGTTSSAKYIMRKTGLEEAQAGIKIAGGNISNLRYAEDTTHMAESLLMNVKEKGEKVG